MSDGKIRVRVSTTKPDLTDPAIALAVAALNAYWGIDKGGSWGASQITAMQRALAAAGVAPQPEPEYEYGNEVTFPDHTQIMPVLDRDTAMKFAWLQPAFRREKAGDWEPVPNQPDGSE